MTKSPHKAHHKLGSKGLTRNEYKEYSKQILETAKTPLTTKQIAETIHEKTGKKINLQVLGHILNKEIPMIQREKQRIKNGCISLYSLPQLIGGNEG